MEDSVRIKGVRSIQELTEIITANILQKMEEKGILPDNEAIEIKKLQKRALQKRWLKVTDIQKSKLWGDLTKAGILAIIKKLPENEIRFDQHRSKPFYEVSKRIAEIKAEERGII
jgi:hypothetical protein